jgi:hypothetical protein
VSSSPCLHSPRHSGGGPAAGLAVGALIQGMSRRRCLANEYRFSCATSRTPSRCPAGSELVGLPMAYIWASRSPLRIKQKPALWRGGGQLQNPRSRSRLRHLGDRHRRAADIGLRQLASGNTEPTRNMEASDLSGSGQCDRLRGTGRRRHFHLWDGGRQWRQCRQSDAAAKQ